MMTNSGPAWWKDQFTLAEHGDSYERLWWPLIREELPEYELLWRGHVVATTNRIDSTMPRNDSRWIAFRNDPHIDNDLERLVMHQYSIFYFYARASLAYKYQPHLFPEDCFILLDIAISNLKDLLQGWRRLVDRLALKAELLPSDHYLSQPALAKIRLYRGAYVHSARIGRGWHVPEDHIPKWEPDPSDHTGKHAKWSRSWREVQMLPTEKFENARELTQSLQLKFAHQLNVVYRSIREALDSRVKTKQYRKCFALDDHNQVITPVHPSTAEGGGAAASSR